MMAKIAGASAVVAVIVGLMIPDEMFAGSNDVIITVLAIWYMSCIFLWFILEERKNILAKRKSLSCKAHRRDPGNRKNLPVNIRIKKRWPVIIPAEKVQER